MQDIPTVLGDVIERNARYFPARPPSCCEERRVTYSEFAARVRKFANALASGGLQPQARFAILAQNCLEYFEAVGAAERAGFIAVTLNWRLSPPELAQIVADCTPTVLIFEAAVRRAGRKPARLGGIERFIVIGAATDWAESYEEVLAAAPDTPPATRPAPGDGVYLIYTSGTTGRPKGVLLSHRAILTAAVGISWESGVRPADRMLIVMPLFHIGGKINQLANMVHRRNHLPAPRLRCDGDAPLHRERAHHQRAFRARHGARPARPSRSRAFSQGYRCAASTMRRRRCRSRSCARRWRRSGRSSPRSTA